MILHANAALSHRQRERLVSLVAAGMTITAAALLVGCSRQTASKWVGRARRGESLSDRSSRPHRSPRRTAAVVEQAVLRARRELREGPHMLGWRLCLAASTVHAILRRHGCSRLQRGQPREPIVRYERERPGELVHVDAKKLGRIIVPRHRVTGDRSRRAAGKAGWQYLFVAIDDASRLGVAALYPTRPPTRRSPFSGSCCASTSVTASRSSACSPTTASASSAAGPTPAPSVRSESKRRGPTGHRRTAKQSGSSEPCSSGGPAPTLTRTSTSAPRSCQQRSSHTIGSGHTAPSEGRRPSSASTICLGRTPRSRRRSKDDHVTMRKLDIRNEPGQAVTSTSARAIIGISFAGDRQDLGQRHRPRQHRRLLPNVRGDACWPDRHGRLRDAQPL
jgi:transposase